MTKLDDAVRRMEELAAASTPGPHVVQRYDHGGGRVYSEAFGKPGESPYRILMVDYYQEGDRELGEAQRNSTAALLDLVAAVAEETFGHARTAEGADGHPEDAACECDLCAALEAWADAVLTGGEA